MPAIRYFVTDVDVALAFYIQLGFTLADRWGPPFAIAEKDGLQLWLSGPGTSAANPMPDGRIPAAGGWNRIVVQVEDLTALAESLRAAGVVFRNTPLCGPGGTQLLIDDPDGNPVELFEPRE